MHICIRLAFIALVSVATALPAVAQDTAGPTARLLSRAVVTGVLIGAEVESRKGQVPPEVMTCLRAIDPQSLESTYQRMLVAEFSERERATLDAFYGSELGELELASTFNELRDQQGLPITNPVEATPEQEAALDAFRARPESAKLDRITADNSGEFVKTLRADVEALISRCM